jgi:hypothetical protein
MSGAQTAAEAAVAALRVALEPASIYGELGR